MEHYFTSAPTAASRECSFTQPMAGRDMHFTSDAGVFSKGRVDPGTMLLIEALTLRGNERILDWGCGIGPIGMACAALAPQGHVVMVDVNARAADLARRNAAANGLGNVEVVCGDGFSAVAGLRFDLVVSNPPIRAGKAVLHELIEAAPAHLCASGRLVLVARTSQGVKSLARKMEEVFGNVSELEKGSGFRVVASVSRA